MTSDHASNTDRFYALLEQLAARTGEMRPLSDCTPHDMPTHGVYFFFEPGQTRADGSPRVVRVGTHALTSTSRTRLWSRLAQHRGTLAGARPGGGNHRGNIFRHHVGTALLATGVWDPAVAASWNQPHVDRNTRQAEYPLERAVSDHIAAMPVLWLPVPTPDARATVERHSIALLSCRTGGVDAASAGWLGNHAASPKVRTSGLWNVNHVDDTYDPTYLETLGHLVKETDPARAWTGRR